MTRIVHGEARRVGDGRVNSPEYRSYNAMKTRCCNPKSERYSDYGGRGITICDRWLHGDGRLSGFQCFLVDMGRKPTSAHTLDRRDNGLGYSPGNCRWATPAEQNRNTRQNRMIVVCGVEVCAADAVHFTSQSPSSSTIRKRLSLGWDADDAVLTPAGCEPIPGMEVCF